MASFQLDHNLSRRLAPALRAFGQDCVAARDLGLEGADDDIQLTTATDAGRILVTHNRKDFIALHRAWRRWSRHWGVTERHGGILVLLPQKPELPILDEVVAGHAIAGELHEYLRPPGARWRHEAMS